LNISDDELRGLFPITKELVYFDHASTGPMPSSTRTAVETCLDTYSRQAQFDFNVYFSKLARARLLVAKLIGADPEEITFTQNTSEGVYIALINIPMQEGDKVIVMDEVFPTVRYVADHNIPHAQKIYLKFCRKDPVAVLRNNLDKKVKAVVIDHVQFFTGEVIDLPRLSNFLMENEVKLVIDGIQAIGALNMSVKDINIDFLAVGASKWLFGPNGVGFLYVNKKNFKSLNRLHTGWLGASWKNFEDFELNPPLFDDARMFEQGTRNVIGIISLMENCRLLQSYGMDNVEKRILGIKTRLIEGFKELSYDILTPLTGRQSGIVTARPKKDATSVYNLLQSNKIVVSLRNRALRFSPHFYNNEEEANKILEVLRL